MSGARKVRLGELMKLGELIALARKLKGWSRAK
jgi:hypothetical protein